ncbi:DJ-1/PfpI family protein [Aureibacter tunicatorum]|uniref:Cyclohexyl-isocyanide hydratase n=1 Tax=Aureibacter tunicatorum TaxID=866807 RepID=A0AAE4BRW3_9BACT|nr:DJ-1/PfpI family protein [Aureibacter tunicatorum]MDR6238270.1 cyclohexyl-isocyanide hydratase [Aureibacter tunicatorum]BDD03303.1 hypothetical protein AUTU_07860 [Aureibacter tunicatorum]
MSILKKINIGFILTPGFRPADVIELDAVFRFHPRNKVFYLSEDSHSKIYGKSGMGMVSDTSFEDCPKLDVLVVGEMDDSAFFNESLLSFIVKQSHQAQYVIGISNGVKLLYQAGVLSQQQVTADRRTLEDLKTSDLRLVDERRFVRDGKFITSGPSTGAIEAAFFVFDQFRSTWLTKFTEFTLEYDAHIQFPLKKEIILDKPLDLKALNVGVLTTPGLYLPDIMGAVDVLGSLPNAKFYYLSNEKGTSNSIINFGAQVISDTTFDECPQLDVLIVGATHPRYVSNERVIKFILKQEKKAASVISVCAGTFIIGATGLLRGRNAATNYHQVSDLPMIGAKIAGKEVECDGKFMSAGPAVGSYEVGLKAVEVLAGKEWAQYIEHEVLEFSPNPLYGTNPRNASKSILSVTHFASFFLKRIYRPFIKKGLAIGKS